MDAEFMPRKRRPKKQRRRGMSRARKRARAMSRNAKGHFVARKGRRKAKHKTRAKRHTHVTYRRDHRGRLRRHIVKGTRTKTAKKRVKQARRGRLRSCSVCGKRATREYVPDASVIAGHLSGPTEGRCATHAHGDTKGTIYRLSGPGSALKG